MTNNVYRCTVSFFLIYQNIIDDFGKIICDMAHHLFTTQKLMFIGENKLVRSVHNTVSILCDVGMSLILI